MNEIIKIEKRNFNNEIKESVSARTLHEVLGLDKSQIARWLKTNIVNNNFAIEHEDWEGFDIYVEGNLIKDYSITIELAKKICMLSRTEKGERVRNYFIQIEKEYKNNLKLQNQKQLNTINLNDYDNYQFYYMNDILLSFPYFRYKINKDTGFPLVNIEDYVKCVGFKSYSLYLLEKDLKNNKEVMEFNKLYEITTDKFKLFKDYLEQFRQAFKKTKELKILQDLNNCQVIEEYEKKPAIADYMNYIGTEKLYTATEIGSILGISGCMVGKIANRLNLKIEKFGAWFKDKASHSIKEVQTFKYNKNIIEELRKYLNTETKLITA